MADLLTSFPVGGWPATSFFGDALKECRGMPPLDCLPNLVSGRYRVDGVSRQVDGWVEWGGEGLYAGGPFQLYRESGGGWGGLIPLGDVNVYSGEIHLFHEATGTWRAALPSDNTHSLDYLVVGIWPINGGTFDTSPAGRYSWYFRKGLWRLTLKLAVNRAATFFTKYHEFNWQAGQSNDLWLPAFEWGFLDGQIHGGYTPMLMATNTAQVSDFSAVLDFRHYCYNTLYLGLPFLFPNATQIGQPAGFLGTATAAGQRIVLGRMEFSMVPISVMLQD